MVDNKFSTPSKISSGVPQGSVLGPLLFQLFINDLPNGIESSVKLYADDVLILRSITTPNNYQTLQNDQTKLALWSANWQMPFNLTKCELLTVTNSPHPSIYHYKLNDYLYRGFSLSNILGLQYLITYHGHLISLKLSVKLTKSNPFSGEISLTAQGTLKLNAIKHTFAQSLNMLQLYGPLKALILKVILILLRCSNGKQPDLCLTISQDLLVSVTC